MRSYWLLVLIWLVVVITLVLALRHSIEIRSKRLGIIRFPSICKFSLTVFFYFKLYWGILSVLWNKIAYISTIENKHQPSYFYVKQTKKIINKLLVTFTSCPWSANTVHWPVNANSLRPKILMIKPERENLRDKTWRNKVNMFDYFHVSAPESFPLFS